MRGILYIHDGVWIISILWIIYIENGSLYIYIYIYMKKSGRLKDIKYNGS